MTKTLTYKGYIGSIEIDIESNSIFGKILHINDLVTYEATTPGGLKAEFELAVDDYLDLCKQTGLEPEKSLSGNLNIRISPTTHLRVAKYATAKGKSINFCIGELLENQLDGLKLSTAIKSQLNTQQSIKKLNASIEDEPNFKDFKLRVVGS